MNLNLNITQENDDGSGEDMSIKRQFSNCSVSLHKKPSK